MTNQNGRGRNTFFNPNKIIVNGGTCLFEMKKKHFEIQVILTFAKSFS